MDLLAQQPRLRELLISLAILGGSYFGARLLSYAFAKILTRAAARTATALDDRLVGTLKLPLTFVLFLTGAFVALERLPLAERWSSYLHSFLYVVGILLVALAVGRAYGIVLRWYTTESPAAAAGGFATEVGPLASKLGNLFIGLLATITILQHLGVNVASLLVSLGVGSLAVGLAAQDTLANMIAGFTLLLDRPFKLGDRIQLATGEVGDVEAIGMRATRMKTLDETTLVIPNSVLVKERLVNLTRPSRHIATRLEVGVAYGTDLAKARRILVEATLASQYAEPAFAPQVIVTRFADFSITLRLIFWARDYAQQGQAVSDVYEEILRRFDQAGIEIPFPVRRVIHEHGSKEGAKAGEDADGEDAEDTQGAQE